MKLTQARSAGGGVPNMGAGRGGDTSFSGNTRGRCYCRGQCGAARPLPGSLSIPSLPNQEKVPGDPHSKPAQATFAGGVSDCGKIAQGKRDPIWKDRERPALEFCAAMSMNIFGAEVSYCS